MTTRKILDQSGLPEGVVKLRLHQYAAISRIQPGDIIRLDMNTRFDHWIKVGSIEWKGEEWAIFPEHSENTLFTFAPEKVFTRLTEQRLLPLAIEDVNTELIEYIGKPLSAEEQLTPEECQLVLDHFCQMIEPADLIPSIEALFQSGQLVSRINLD